MKYPVKSNNPASSITIPDLVGGINYRDGISEILDNQLTDASNVWKNAGMLRSRPGLKTNVNMGILLSSDNNVYTTDIKKTISGNTAKLCYAKSGSNILFWWQHKDGISQVGSIMSSDERMFVFESGNYIYAFLRNKTIYRMLKSGTVWSSLPLTDIYAPRVIIHAEFKNGEFSGTNFEGYNLIGNRYRIIASSIPRNSSSSVQLSYVLPQNMPENAYISVSITLASGTYYHSVVCSGMSETTETQAQGDTYRLKCNPQTKTISFINSSDNVVTQTSSDFIEDNLEINACYDNYTSDNAKIFDNSKSIWFGGTLGGLYSGTRLFVYGNNNTVFWSGLNNPLYFPENNYFNVGNENTVVTAMAKQSNTICIFKENEIYYSYYAQNEISEEDLEDQSVIDVESQGVYFPLVLLTSETGCDVPNSVQLCRNRLVFANTSGKIYSIVTQNQNSERNLYKLSEMVERNLQITADATSTDWEGYYLIKSNNTIWLMEYDCYGYQYAYSYAKNEDANIKIPWYRFDIEGIKSIFAIDNYLFMMRYESGYAYASFFDSTDTEYTDERLIFTNSNVSKVNEIYNSFIKTKMFDFKSPNTRKLIKSISISSGNETGNTITVKIITNKGTEEIAVNPQFSDNSPYSEDYLRSICVYPSIKGFTKFSVSIEANGMFTAENMVILIKALGVER